MEVLNSRNYLLKELARLFLLQPLILNDIVEELTARHVLSDEVKLPRGFYDFIELDDVGMPGQLEDLYLSCDSLDVDVLDDLVFLENLNGYFLAREVVSAQLHFPKCTLSNSLSYQVVADAL